MKRRLRASDLFPLFLEYLVAAIAEALVAGVGWVLRKAHKRWKKKRRREDDG